MRKVLLIGAAAFAILPVGAMAKQPMKVVPAMRLGQTTPPPLGLIELCQRQPTECVASGEIDQDKLAAMKVWASQARWAAVFGAPANTPPEAPASAFPGESGGRGATQRDDTNRLLLRRLPSPSQEKPSPAIDAEPFGASVDATEMVSNRAVETPSAVETVASSQVVSALTARETAKINTRINRSIRRASDAELYGRADYWAGAGDRVKQGDCEDYVMAKRHALIQAGAPDSALSIATVRTRYGELHAVLLVATAEGEVVLDNLSPWILPWNEAPYTWIDRQVGGSPTHWVHIGL